MYVLLLEDDPSRVRAMRAVLADLLPAAEVAAFDNAPDATAFLRDHCTKTILISFDPGDGRDVASCLATRKPSCPAIVHSANYQMVPVMIETLRDAGWPATIVTPTANCNTAGST